MSKGRSAPSREEVLDAFAVEPDHDRLTLERYLRDHPRYVTELVELSRELSRVVDEDENSLTAHEQALIESAWQSHVSLEMKVAEDPLADLSVSQLRDMSQSLGVPRQVITAFRERRVKLDSVPRSFLTALAQTVSCSLDSLLSGLAMPSESSLARSYKADVKPSAGAAISFEQLLIDASVPESRLAELLARDE